MPLQKLNKLYKVSSRLFRLNEKIAEKRVDTRLHACNWVVTFACYSARIIGVKYRIVDLKESNTWITLHLARHGLCLPRF
jgi:hypothetical protein